MKADSVYLKHILDSIRKIEKYASVGEHEFMQTDHWQDAIVRQLEIIGEATKNISISLRQNNPDIPWRRMAGLRDVLIHDYMGVDLRAVWEVVEKHLPKLKEDIEVLLKKMP